MEDFIWISHNNWLYIYIYIYIYMSIILEYVGTISIHCYFRYKDIYNFIYNFLSLVKKIYDSQCRVWQPIVIGIHEIHILSSKHPFSQYTLSRLVNVMMVIFRFPLPLWFFNHYSNPRFSFQAAIMTKLCK